MGLRGGRAAAPECAPAAFLCFVMLNIFSVRFKILPFSRSISGSRDF